MNILALKLILAPVIIGSASLAGRKWGSAVSGWMVALPLTSGPVVFFLALSHNRAFAADAARGVLSGGFSLIAYILTYVWMARRFNWTLAFPASILAFAGMTLLMQNFIIPLIPLFFCVLAVIFIGVQLIPKQASVEVASNPGKWDIPARILLGTSFILLITAIAPYIGARLTGLLTTIPLYASILTVFTHRHQGSAGAINVLRGVVYGLFSFAAFYLALGLLIEHTHLILSFGVATLASLIVQGSALFILHLEK